MDCLFCQIIDRKIPSEIVYEDDEVLAFRDVSPQAPMHVLVVPKRHIPSLNELKPDDAELVGKIIYRAKELAATEGHDKNGFRLVMNCNKDGGQTVFHIHCHVLGGRAMHWPPG